MADRASRKARQRQKREKKRQALRRAASVSPYKRAAAGALVACRVNADWRERGQATVYVLRRPPGPGAGLAMACFLVDLWCAGLKDAWGRFDMLREEYDDIVERMGDRMDVRMPDMLLDEAAAIAAGGIRFAVQNGFRLPPHLQRWTAFLSGGSKLDWQHAHLSAFGVEGGTKLRWVGPMHDLRARLIGSTVQQFIARPDVEFIGDIGPSMAPGDFDEEWDDGDEDDDEYDDEEEDDFAGEGAAFSRPPLEDAEVISATDGPVVDRLMQSVPHLSAEAAGSIAGNRPHGQTDADRERDEGYDTFVRMTRNLVAAVQAWCFNEGLVPSQQLERAAAFTLGSGMMSFESGRDVSPDDVMDRLMQTVPEDEAADMEIALQQVGRFIRTYRSPAALMAALQAGQRRRAEEQQEQPAAAVGETNPTSGESTPRPQVVSESAAPQT